MDRYTEIILLIAMTLVVAVLFAIVSLVIGFILQLLGIMNIPGLAALFK